MSDLEQIDRVPPLPDRPIDGHKGTFGTVIVVGGSPAMIGAPALCASAALRSGAGLAKVACDASILPFVLSIEPGATGIALSNDPRDLRDRLDESDPSQTAVLAVGPGLGRSDLAGCAGVGRTDRSETHRLGCGRACPCGRK